MMWLTDKPSNRVRAKNLEVEAKRFLLKLILFNWHYLCQYSKIELPLSSLPSPGQTPLTTNVKCPS